MNVLVRPNSIAVWLIDTVTDEHGWDERTVQVPAGTVLGTVQEQAPAFDPLAATRGGQGPNAPLHKRRAVAYLAGPVPTASMLHVTDGLGSVTVWQVQGVRLAEDPRPGYTDLTCWVADVVEA